MKLVSREGRILLMIFDIVDDLFLFVRANLIDWQSSQHNSAIIVKAQLIRKIYALNINQLIEANLKSFMFLVENFMFFG